MYYWRLQPVTKHLWYMYSEEVLKHTTCILCAVRDHTSNPEVMVYVLCETHTSNQECILIT